MLERETIQINSIRTGMDGEDFVVRIKVTNPENRTVYVYGSPRRVFYDNATGKLTLLLHDQNLSQDEEKLISDHLKQPRFIPLEGGTESEIKIKLVPLMRRIRPAAERGNGELFEELRVSEATEVEVEIAHQDTPFYYNPKINNLTQLKNWGDKVSKADMKVTPAEPKTEPKPRTRK